MRMDIVIPNQEFDPWDEYSGGVYYHKSYTRGRGKLWQLVQREGLDFGGKGWRQEINESLAEAPTLSAKIACLDNWATGDILEGHDGMIFTHDEYLEWRDAESAAGCWDDNSMGAQYSRCDPTGVYLADGTKIGSTCSCEDYPCCGH